jgi:arylformamidase
MNEDLRLDAGEARKVSPLYWPAPKGHTFDAAVGALESGEFLRQSKAISDAWGKAGVATRYEELGGMNHFTAADPLADPDSAMVKRLVELARKIGH